MASFLLEALAISNYPINYIIVILASNQNNGNEYTENKGWVVIVLKKQRCCKQKSNAPGYFMIALGAGLFLAYVIPRHLLITLLGLGLIGAGVCFIFKN